MSRHATGPRPWFRKDSPFIWARTTINGQRWAAPTSVARVGDRSGDRAAFIREAATLYLQECERRGAGSRRASLPQAIVESLTLKQLVASFIAHEEDAYTGHDGRHVARYKTDLYQYVLRRWERIDEFTSDAWEHAKKELHRRAGGPLGSRSLAHLGNTLRHFLRYCHAHGFIPSVPELKSPSTKEQRSEQKKIAAMTEKQRDGFLRALLQLGEERAHRIYTVLFWSLLRQNELSALEESWVDWTRAKIRLPPEHSKSGDVEEVGLHPKVRRVLRAVLNERKKDETGPIFGRIRLPPGEHSEAEGWPLRPRLPQGRAGEGEGRRHRRLPRPDAASRGTAFERDDRRGAARHHHRGTDALARWRSSAMADRYLHPTVEAGRRALRRL